MAKVDRQDTTRAIDPVPVCLILGLEYNPEETCHASDSKKKNKYWSGRFRVIVIVNGAATIDHGTNKYWNGNNQVPEQDLSITANPGLFTGVKPDHACLGEVAPDTLASGHHQHKIDYAEDSLEDDR